MKDVDFEVRHGKIFTLLGSNGAGHHERYSKWGEVPPDGHTEKIQELAEKKKAPYSDYRAAQTAMREAMVAKANIDHLLGVAGRENKTQEQ